MAVNVPTEVALSVFERAWIMKPLNFIDVPVRVTGEMKDCKIYCELCVLINFIGSSSNILDYKKVAMLVRFKIGCHVG